LAIVELARLLETLEQAGGETDLRPALAFLAGRDILIGDDELAPARRRAMLLLAAGGDPHRALDLDGRAVTALADELNAPERQAALTAGLVALQAQAQSLERVSAAVATLVADPALGWRAYACALLADELEE
jgi:hypothetical protein